MATYWGSVPWGLGGWGGGELAEGFTLDITLPALTFEGYSASHLDVELQPISFEGYSASLLNDIELQPIAFEGVSALHLNSITLPAITVSLETGNGIELEIKLPFITFEGRSASILNDITLPSLQFEGVGASNLNNIILPPLSATFQTAAILTVELEPIEASFESTSVSCILNIRLPYIRFSGSMATYEYNSLNITLPPIQATFEGGGNIHGSLSITLPALELYATLKGANTLMCAVSTKDGSLTLYTNYLFNSFAIINGRRLAASDAGLIELTGTNDMGVAISASFQTGTHDGGIKNIKWVPNIISVMKSNGVMYIRPVMDGVQKAQKAVISTGSVYKSVNVRTDKGPDGMNVGIQGENYAGSSFEISSLEALLELTKRVGK